MRRKPVLVSCFLVVLAANTFATPQIPDILIYEGREYPIQHAFLATYFKKYPERNPKDENDTCSALWRGYQATFEVIERRIYLKDVRINVCWGKHPQSELKKVVPNGERLFIDWLTGIVTSGYGRNDDDPYSLSSLDAYEKYALFEVDNGRISEVRRFDNKAYLAFKKKQFEAFRKTKDYTLAVKKMLESNPHMGTEDADANILLWIFGHTNSFLVN